MHNVCESTLQLSPALQYFFLPPTLLPNTYLLVLPDCRQKHGCDSRCYPPEPQVWREAVERPTTPGVIVDTLPPPGAGKSLRHLPHLLYDTLAGQRAGACLPAQVCTPCRAQLPLQHKGEHCCERLQALWTDTGWLDGQGAVDSILFTVWLSWEKPLRDLKVKASQMVSWERFWGVTSYQDFRLQNDRLLTMDTVVTCFSLFLNFGHWAVQSSGQVAVVITSFISILFFKW